MDIDRSTGGSVAIGRLAVGLLIFGTAAFWSLRIGYWSRITEEPFSDILDYINVAKNIATDLTFGLPPDRMAYWTPATPTAIAIAIWLGGAEFEIIYRFMIQAIAFSAALLLGFELAKASGRPWLGMAFFLIVAFSRSSIFWSFKLSTEGLSEALLMATTAFALRAVRGRTAVASFLAGACLTLLGLNRPQYVPAALALPLLLALCAWWTSRKAGELAPRAFFRLFAATLLGLCFAWSPWIIRNYLHFGAFVPLSTTGYESFLWDSGAGSIHPHAPYAELRLSDGEILTEFGIRSIQRQAMRYSSEIDRRDFLGRIAAAWLRENLTYYPSIVKQRLWRFIHVNGASGLTQVPREALFTTLPPNIDPAIGRRNVLDRILLDKSPAIVWLALAGLCMALLRRPAIALLLACLWVTPWIMVALVVSAERAVEPLIPVTIWLALYGVVESGLLVWGFLRRKLGPQQAQPTASLSSSVHASR